MSYQPTQEQLENLKLKEGELMLSGDGVFHTIQGEGDRVGYPCTFIRLHHCNLACSWCDTKYSWDRTDERFYTEPTKVETLSIMDLVWQEQQAKGVENFIPEVVFTGGEPLIQQKEIEKVIENNPQVLFQIETNGTVMPSDKIIDYAIAGRVKFNCSPKLPNAGMKMMRTVKPEVLNVLSNIPTTVFKFVCIDEQDLVDVQTYYAPIVDRRKIMIMPEGRTEEANTEHLRNIIERIIALGYRVTPRLQNNLFKGARRT